MRAPERSFRSLAGQFLGAHIDKHQVIVGATGNEVESPGLDRCGEGIGIVDHLLCIGLEFRSQRFAEGHGLGGDDMHQRPALQAGEDRRVDLLGDFFVVAQDEAATRSAQGLVRG